MMELDEAVTYAAALDDDHDTPRECYMGDVITRLAAEVKRLRAMENRAALIAAEDVDLADADVDRPRLAMVTARFILTGHPVV